MFSCSLTASKAIVPLALPESGVGLNGWNISEPRHDEGSGRSRLALFFGNIKMAAKELSAVQRHRIIAARAA
jgi:hypothetical protein